MKKYRSFKIHTPINTNRHISRLLTAVRSSSYLTPLGSMSGNLHEIEDQHQVPQNVPGNGGCLVVVVLQLVGHPYICKCRPPPSAPTDSRGFIVKGGRGRNINMGNIDIPMGTQTQVRLAALEGLCNLMWPACRPLNVPGSSASISITCPLLVDGAHE